MKRPSKITSNFLLLDVEKGRRALAEFLKGYPDYHEGLPVTIEAVITQRFGGDDGVSIEFCCDVKSLKMRD